MSSMVPPEYDSLSRVTPAPGPARLADLSPRLEAARPSAVP